MVSEEGGRRGEGLEERVSALEAKVAEQGEILRSLGHSGGGVKEGGISRDEVRREKSSILPAVNIGERYGDLLRAEWWLTRGGVVLLLLGLVFLFKLSVDEGWITPSIRIVLGVMLGFGLVAGGLRVYVRRMVVGQAMMGGGIAALYASGFAATSLFSLVSVAVAFPAMIAVTAGAFSLAIRQDAPSLAIIGIIGGLSTPFLLYSEGGSVVGLVLYTALVFTGAAAIYLYRGWMVLLVPAAAGVLLSLAVAHLFSFQEQGVQNIALLAGISWCWVVAGVVPVSRSWLLRIRRDAGPMVLPYISWVFALTVTSVVFFGVVAPFSIRQIGAALLVGAAVCGAGAWLLHRSSSFRDGRLVYSHLAAGVGVASVGMVVTLRGWMLFVALSVAAAGLLYLAQRYSDDLARLAGHAYFAVLAAWFMYEVMATTLYATSDVAPFPMLAAMLGGIAIALLVALRVLSGKSQLVYLCGVHVALLAWTFTVLLPFSNGGVLTTIVWGVYGAGLLVVSLRKDGGAAFNVAIATLVLVAGKLFVADLFWVEAIYRVLLFTGVGGMFLALGYYLRSIWKPRVDTTSTGSTS